MEGGGGRGELKMQEEDGSGSWEKIQVERGEGYR